MFRVAIYPPAPSAPPEFALPPLPPHTPRCFPSHFSAHLPTPLFPLTVPHPCLPTPLTTVHLEFLAIICSPPSSTLLGPTSFFRPVAILICCSSPRASIPCFPPSYLRNTIVLTPSLLFCALGPSCRRFFQASVSYEPPRCFEGSPMPLGGPRRSLMTWTLSPALFSVGVPASSLHGTWVRPRAPKACTPLPTSLSTFCSNKRFSATILILSIVNTRCSRPYILFQTLLSLMALIAGFRRMSSTAALFAGQDFRVPLHFLSPSWLRPLWPPLLFSCTAFSSPALNFLIFLSLHFSLSWDDDASLHSLVVLLVMIAVEDPRVLSLLPVRRLPPTAAAELPLLPLPYRCLCTCLP